ncbi:MAG: hypothetical protein PCFJNLEI_04027 [Verrucomicrobiae bacterium]|nr:hypothetical protein [Verrucomicrobiae bacterium]
MKLRIAPHRRRVNAPSVMRTAVPYFVSALWLLLGHTATQAGDEPTPEKLPRWRGFNLLEKFQADSAQPYREEDFRLIAKLGFNFVRLPMDYRVWIKGGDWEQINEAPLRDIDQAVTWGERYGIHVCLNFHRAPGYTVAKPPEARSLWSDPEAQRVCANHWAMFARRYQGIPNSRLSFNLFNEPHGITASNYLAVCRQVVAAIRAEDPARLVICDGMEWGNQPVPELKELRVAQATRGYQPMEISHYGANWVNSSQFLRPRWPQPIPPLGVLRGPVHESNAVPLTVTGPFMVATTLRLRVHTVSTSARLVVAADQLPIWEKLFQCGPGTGEWQRVEFQPKWGTYQGFFDRDYTTVIPAGSRQVQLWVREGDWLRLGEIGLKTEPNGPEDVLRLKEGWGNQTGPIRYAPGAVAGPFHTSEWQDRAWLQQRFIAPWQNLQATGVGVMVGEWGAYHRTPHSVVLRWAADCLANWKEAGWGWALWNFRGRFGILDSERTDVRYEDFEGHKLDRQFLQLLQEN